MKKNEYGRYTIAIENNKGYLMGSGYTKEGQFPFIDEFDFNTLTKKRLYTSNLKDQKEDLMSIKNKNTLNTSKILALFWYMRYNPWVNTLNTSNLKLIVERVFFMRLIGRKIFEENR